MNGERNTAVLVVEAKSGDRRSARTLIAQAVRAVIGAERYRRTYLSAAELRRSDPRNSYRREGQFVLYVSRQEFDSILTRLDESAKAEGWSRTPVDAYFHD